MVRREDCYDLSGRNTFGMKVSCACFLEYESTEDLIEAAQMDLPQPMMHIGSGSNLLFTGDYPGTILHSNIKYYNILATGEEEVLVEVGSGVLMDDFCAWAADNGLWGSENLSGIPGEVGAAAVQNIGAYGAEVKDIISVVRCFDMMDLKEVTFSAAECRYGYRDSLFKHAPAKGRYVVLSVLFRLSKSVSPKLDYGNLRSMFEGRDVFQPSEIRNAVLEIRHGKLPDPEIIHNAGSFFKNPVVSPDVFERVQSIVGSDVRVPHFEAEGGMVKIPAAWAIEQCGLKGFAMNGAAVFEKQPLVIVNLGDASPQDIIALENRIISDVKDKFGIELHPEVEHI